MCNMTKNLRFKMKLKIPSFRSCCSSSKCLPILPSIYCLSPMNPKARDNNSNAFPNLPPPPPPTPSSPDVFQYMVQNITSNRASSCNNPHIVYSESTFCAMDHGDSFNNKDEKVVIKSKGRTSTSSRTIANGLHNHHNHEKDMEEEEVSESLLSGYNSFSDEFFHNENRHEIPKAISQIEATRLHTFILSKSDQVKVSCSRLPFFNSYKPQKEFCHSSNPEISKTISPLENLKLHTYTLSQPNQVSVSCTRMPYFNGNKQKKEKFANHGKKISNIEKVGGGSKNIQMKKKEMVLRPTMTQNCSSSSSVEGIVKDSYAVVKKSNDPYKDFKKSMMEMMMEMEMLKSEDMEQLLQCFLDLNSRCYHGVIVRAFMDIWQQLFSETCLLQKSQNNH